MPFVRVVNKKFLLKQLLILAPLSMSGIYLATQVISSISSRSGNSNASAPTAQTAQRSANPSARTGTPLNGPTGDPGDPFAGGNPGGTGGAPAGAVPVDGGLTLLLAAGLGYGARKAYQNRSTEKETQQI